MTKRKFIARKNKSRMRNEMDVKTVDKQVNLSLLVKESIFMFQKDEQS